MRENLKVRKTKKEFHYKSNELIIPQPVKWLTVGCMAGIWFLEGERIFLFTMFRPILGPCHQSSRHWNSGYETGEAWSWPLTLFWCWGLEYKQFLSPLHTLSIFMTWWLGTGATAVSQNCLLDIPVIKQESQ
jgi:hypothetical protein